MEFLVQTEQKLAVEISGNYQHLLEQQRAHEVSYASTFLGDKIVLGLWKMLQNAMWKHESPIMCAESAQMHAMFLPSFLRLKFRYLNHKNAVQSLFHSWL